MALRRATAASAFLSKLRHHHRFNIAAPLATFRSDSNNPTTMATVDEFITITEKTEEVRKLHPGESCCGIYGEYSGVRKVVETSFEMRDGVMRIRIHSFKDDGA